MTAESTQIPEGHVIRYYGDDKDGNLLCEVLSQVEDRERWKEVMRRHPQKDGESTLMSILSPERSALYKSMAKNVRIFVP